jgi:PRTRC genetic system protein C
MPIEVKPIQRRFSYNGVQLPDVPGLDAKGVRDMHAEDIPELISAEVVYGDISHGVQEITFRRAVETKG